MKTSSFLTTLALLALSSTSSPAFTRQPAIVALFGELPVARIPAVTPANGDAITVGTSRIHVRLRLGSPAWVLTDGSWVYRNYVVRASGQDAGRAASLLVRFASNRVVHLAMIDEPTRLALQAPPSLPANNPFVAVATTSR
jgi:hypothetical protein